MGTPSLLIGSAPPNTGTHPSPRSQAASLKGKRHPACQRKEQARPAQRGQHPRPVMVPGIREPEGLYLHEKELEHQRRPPSHVYG